MWPMPSASRRLAGALLVLALGAAACGGSDDDARFDLKTPGVDRNPAQPAPSATPAPRPARVDADADRVIRRWADTLRRGDVRGAARWFALPSLVSNNSPPIRLTTRADVRAFNRSLTCGAEVTATEPAVKGYVMATLRLTERPGAGRCGAGTGETARAAFLVKRDKIVEWVRMPVPPPDAAPHQDSETPA